MHVLQFEITKPTDDSAFEDMCTRVYGEVFGDPLPKINGRKGQAQAGIDVFIASAHGRVGVQCKRYVDGALTFKHVEQEVARADKAATPIVRLVVATTAVRDAKLLREVQDFSDARLAAGKYTVEAEFWEDICGHIRGSGKLQNDYAPNAPGALFHRQDQHTLAMRATLLRIESRLDVGAGLPAGRSDSVNTFITSQLDSVNDLLKTCRFRDASEDLARIGTSLELFDDHQRARWYLQRGVCTWHLDSGKAAAPDFLKAFELYPGDEKMAAAGVRALLLQDDVAGAAEAGAKAMGTFAASIYVWIAYANARMIRGDELTLADVPLAMRENSDVLQMLAWARKKVGDLAGAIELSGRALSFPEAGFFVRSTALALALEAAADDPVKSAYGLVGANEIAALERAVAALSPRRERVWSVQSTESLADTLVHLGHASIVLGRPDDALALVDEAKHAGMLAPRLKRVALDAYRRLDRLDDLLRQGREWVDDLEEEALVLLAETASEAGDVDLVSAVSEAAKKLTLNQPETPSLLAAMRWVAFWRSREGRPQAVAEAKAANLATSSSLALICGGARVLFAAGEESEAEAAVTQACTLVNDDSPSPIRLLLADLLYSTRNYARAIPHYERIVGRGCYSELHGRLLVCYVRTGARRKGRELIQAFPDGWASDDRLRELAMELGQQAADWSFLVPLAELQCERAPESAGGWLLRLVLDLKTKKMHRFHHALEAVPAELKGGHRQLAQVAALELRFGSKVAGMRRLYRLFRRHMDDLEAASGYFIGIVAAPEDLPGMDEALTVVAAGTAVELQEEPGGLVTVSIDPEGIAPLPPREGFYSADSADVAALLGVAVGASVELPGPFSTKRKYVVRSITSVHRHLLLLAQGRFQTSMSAKGLVMSVPVPRTSTGADFSHMHAMLKQQSAHSKLALDTYVNGPLTLGILAKLLGRSVVEIPGGWPTDGPQLFVCAGTQEERVAAGQLCSSGMQPMWLTQSPLRSSCILDVKRRSAPYPRFSFRPKLWNFLKLGWMSPSRTAPGVRLSTTTGRCDSLSSPTKTRSGE